MAATMMNATVFTTKAPWNALASSSVIPPVFSAIRTPSVVNDHRELPRGRGGRPSTGADLELP